jgi:eukaryotic-like serine/threonine-protein kinase
VRHKDCLTRAELADFILGDLPDELLEGVSEHLENCPRCEALARTMDGLSDPIIAGIRRSAAAAEMPPDTLPERIGSYVLLGEIGRGGMGVVYRAHHEHLRRDVALKMLLTGPSADRGERIRFRAEAEAVARLQHPHIVQIFEVGEHDNSAGGPRPYVALEYVDGANLAARLAGRPQPPGQAAVWLEPLARAVDYAHTQGVVHRDLKPSNVLLTRDDQPKLCDFGVAKILGGSDIKTRSGTLVGTVEYMAPEQAEGKGMVGPPADIYALGALLYVMLTGRPPFQGASLLDTLQQIRTQEPVSPRRLQPTVPRDLETICLKCLQKEPVRRYATASDLADDLLRFAAGEPIVARPVGPLERSARWMRRHPTVAGLIAAVVLVALTAFGLVAWQWREALRQRRLADGRAGRERQARDEVEKISAGLILDRGINLAVQGEVAHGLSWLARGLERAAGAGDVELERVARVNLAAWREQLVRPVAELPHEDWAWALAFSPDGRTAATGSMDRTARLWDAATGRPRGEPMRHDGPVLSLAFSPDGSTLLTGSGSPDERSGEARFWDAATGQPSGAALSHPGSVERVAFSPDGRTFVTVSPQRAQLWRSADRRPKGAPMGHGATVRTAAFSPDGRTVATGGDDGTVRLWDTNGQPIGAPLRHGDPVWVLAFNPDGRTLATGSRVLERDERNVLRATRPGEVRLWDVAARRPLAHPLIHRGPIKALTFSPDGRVLATGSIVAEKDGEDGEVRIVGGEAQLWSVITGQSILTPLAHPKPVWALAFDPSGHLLLTGCEDRRARFFVAATGTLLDRPLAHEGTVVAVAFSPDGRRALTASAGGYRRAAARLWDVPRGLDLRTLSRHRGPIVALTFSPDRRHLLTASRDGTARLWDTRSGEPRGEPMRHGGSVRAASFSPDGRVVLTGCSDRTAQLWEAATGRPRGEPMPHDGPVVALAFSPDSRIVLTGTLGGGPGTGGARLWDVETARPLGPPLRQPSGLTDVAFSRDGRMFLTAGPVSARFWDTRTLRPLEGLGVPGDRAWLAAAFGPDGLTAVTDTRRTARIQDLASGRILREWTHDETSWRATFSPDGRTLLLASPDRSARLWDVSTGRSKAMPLPHTGPVVTGTDYESGEPLSMAFSPDSRAVASGCTDRAARLWDVSTGKLLGPPLAQHDDVTAVQFDPAGRLLAVGGHDGLVRLWALPAPVDGDPECVRLWVESLTAAELDPGGEVRTLAAAAIQARRRHLDGLGWTLP